MLQLKKFPDITVSTREEARKSRPHSEESRFRLLSREEGSFLYVVEKEFRRSRRISRGGALHRKEERNSRVLPPIPASPRFLSPFQGKLFSLHCLDFNPRIDSHHGGTWDSPVGKPRGKATDPLIHAKGTVTLLQQLGRKAHVHAPTRDEDCLPWGDSRNTPKIHVSTGEESSLAPTPHEVLGPSIDGRGIPRVPGATRMGTGLS